MGFFEFILFTIVFLVVGSIGFLGMYGGEILLIIGSVIAFLVVLGLLAWKKGVYGIIIFFVGLLGTVIALIAFGSYQESPEYKEREAIKQVVYALEVSSTFEWRDYTLEPGDLIYVYSKKNIIGTDVTLVPSHQGHVSFFDRKSIDSIEARYPLGRKLTLNLKLFHEIQNQKDWTSLSYDELNQLIKKMESKKTSNKNRDARDYLEQIVGKTFNISVHNKTYGLSNGGLYDRIEIIINDEETLTYSRGEYIFSFSHDNDGGIHTSWIPKNITESGVYDYIIEKGFWGNYYLKFNTKEVKLDIDDNQHVIGLEDR